MTADTLGAPGRLDLPGVTPYPNGMDIISDPAELPADRSQIADDTLIVPAVWAELQGVKVATVYRTKTTSDKRRGTAEAKPGDMPASDKTIGQTPAWTMATYRAWDAARPGKGAGAGRPAGSGQGERVRVRLPIECPHCHHEITAEDLERAKNATDGQTARSKPATAARRPGGPRRPRVAGKSR